MEDVDRDRLTRIEKNLALLRQSVDISNDQTRGLLSRHDRVLHGKDGAGGIVRSVDRLERAEGRRSWHIRALWTALLGAVASWAGSLISKP